MIRRLTSAALSLMFFSALLVPAFVPLEASAATLTNDQVNSIVNLLTSFGADASVIANVKATLGGGATSTKPSIQILAPNGGEKWELGVTNSVTWAPYQYNPDVNPSKDVSAYLEKKNTDGTFTTLGRVEESGKASIHWITGDLNSQNGIFSQVTEGQYYIRVVNNVTGASDRSDNSFSIIARPVDVLVNGSAGPVSLSDNQKVTITWSSTGGRTVCDLSGVRETINGNNYIENLPASGTRTFYAAVYSEWNSNTIAVRCRVGNDYSTNVYDAVAVNASATAMVQVVTPNGGEKIDPTKQMDILYKHAGLKTFSAALYKNDQWKAWIVKDQPIPGPTQSTISFIPSALLQALGEGDNAGAIFKIYITGIKADGTGYVDDKSDAPFSFVPSSTTTAGAVVVSGNQITGGRISANTSGTALGTYKLSASSVESVSLTKLRFTIRAVSSGDVAVNKAGTDISNLSAVINGTTYPARVISSGLYSIYEITFPDAVIPAGKSIDMLVRGDIGGSRGGTVDLWSHRSDFILVGQKSNAVIVPTSTNSKDDTNFYWSGWLSIAAQSDTTQTATIKIINPSATSGYVIGDNIPVIWSHTGAPKNSQVLLSLEGIKTTGSGVSGGQWQGPVIAQADATGTWTWKTGPGLLELPGTYQITAKIRECDPRGCTYNAEFPGVTTSVKTYATSNPIQFTIKSPVTNIPTGSATVSLSATPAAQTLVAGVADAIVARYFFSAAGEDVRFVVGTLSYTDNMPIDPINCALYDGKTRVTQPFNPISVSAGETGRNTIIFDTPVSVSKGVVLALDLHCAIPSSAKGGSFKFGIKSADHFGAVGVQSGADIKPTVSENLGNTMTVAVGGAGSLNVSLDASSPSYQLAAAGSKAMTLGVFKFSAKDEMLQILKIGLSLIGGKPADLSQVYLYTNTGTLLGSAIFTGTNTTATAVLANTFSIGKDSDAKVVVKADIAQIGTSQPGTPGDLLQINLNKDTTGVGASSGTTIPAAVGSVVPPGTRIFRAFPTVASIGLPLEGLSDGRLMRFSVTAPGVGSISLAQIPVIISGLAAGVNGQVDLMGFTDSGFSKPIPGTSGGGINGLPIKGEGKAGGLLWFPAPVVIPAGTTYYFELRDSGKGTGLTNTRSLQTGIYGQGTYTGMVSATSLVGKDAYFVWSPNDFTTSSFSDADWTNGYGIPGLPVEGIFQVRVGTVTTTAPAVMSTPTPNTATATATAATTTVAAPPTITPVSMAAAGAAFTRDTASGAWMFKEDTATSSHQMNSYLTLPTGLSTADTWTLSFLAQPRGRSAVTMYILNSDNQGSEYGAVECTLSGVGKAVSWKTTTAKNFTAQASLGSDGWYRCLLQVAPGALIGGNHMRLSLQLVASSTTSYKGDGVSGVLIKDLILTYPDGAKTLQFSKVDSGAASSKMASAFKDLVTSMNPSNMMAAVAEASFGGLINVLANLFISTGIVR